MPCAVVLKLLYGPWQLHRVHNDDDDDDDDDTSSPRGAQEEMNHAV